MYLKNEQSSVFKYVPYIFMAMLELRNNRSDDRWGLACGGDGFGSIFLSASLMRFNATQIKKKRLVETEVFTRISSNKVPWSTLRNSWSHTGMSSVLFSLFSSSSGGGGSSLWWVHHWMTWKKHTHRPLNNITLNWSHNQTNMFGIHQHCIQTAAQTDFNTIAKLSSPGITVCLVNFRNRFIKMVLKRLLVLNDCRSSMNL